MNIEAWHTKAILIAVVLSLAGLAPKQQAIVHYCGKLGEASIDMYLSSAPIMRKADGQEFQTGIRFSGYYSKESDSKKIQLKGSFNAQGMEGASDNPITEITEYIDGKGNGYFAGDFSDSNVYEGTWTQWQPEMTSPFKVEVCAKK